MALSGLDIYKLLPKTNCRECGFPTCLAFAMQLAKKTVSVDKCPYVTKEAKDVLEASSQPPIKLVTIGAGEKKLETGNETVLFRHEEKFRNPSGIGFIIEDSLTDAQIKEKLSDINALSFDRVGQNLAVNLVAIRQTAGAGRFQEACKIVSQATELGIVLISPDTAALRSCLSFLKDKKPLIYKASKENLGAMAALAKEFKVPVVVSGADINEVSALTREASAQGAADIVIETGARSIAGRIWDLTQIRRLALKKADRSLGYPVIMTIDAADPYQEAMEAATYIAKYAGIILLKGTASWEVLSLLTLRQNIYTDPQKPLQVEPKLNAIGQVSAQSPVLVTTNFSLSYFTVLGEVEASKIPSYIMSVDTEGMSVLTAWAAEKFNAEIIAKAIGAMGVPDAVKHKKIVIPGYLAVMSGDLQEQSGWEVIVGPKEAAGIPSFLKSL